MMMNPFARRLSSLMVFVLLLLGGSPSANAWSEDDQNRWQALNQELRCLVCQNQSIADSHADLAVDLREQTRSMIEAGKSDQEIRDYMTARYGDFVLYRPPFKPVTWLLWVGPFIVLILALMLVLRLRRSGAERSTAKPSPADQPRDSEDSELDQLLRRAEDE